MGRRELCRDVSHRYPGGHCYWPSDSGTPLRGACAGARLGTAEAFGILRRLPPELRLRGRSVVVCHPLLKEPLVIEAADVHSLWIGPFEQPPPGPRDRWVGRRVFPANVLDVSGRLPQADPAHMFVVAFARTLSPRPPLRIPAWVWFVQRQRPPFVAVRDVNGLMGVVEDREAALKLLQASGMTATKMPADVREWLSSRRRA